MSAELTNAAWYVARGTGVTTLCLLTLTVMMGITTRSSRPLPGLPRFAVAELHRTISLLVVLLLGVHISTLLIDPYAQLKLADVVLPFTATYRPMWLGLGTLASDLVAALVVTSLLRHRLGRRPWRAVHWLAYVSWPVAVAHGLGTGTDSGTAWLWAVTAGCVLAVGTALVWRASDRFSDRSAVRDTSAVPLPLPAPAIGRSRQRVSR